MNSKWEKIHQQSLISFLENLNNSGIEWLIIRNYEGLPEVNTSKDIDIAIPRKRWKEAHSIALKVFKDYGYSHYELKNYQFINCYTFFNFSGYSFKLDFFDCNEYLGLITHSFNDLYSKCLKRGLITGTNNIDNAIIILLRPLLGGNYIKTKYIPEILDSYTLSPELFVSELNRIFGERISRKIVPFLNAKDIYNLPTIRKNIIQALFFNNVRKYKLKAISRFIKHYTTTFFTRAKIYKNKNFIAVLGADGTGKSTFVEGLTKSIGYYYSSDISKSIVFHHRPTIIPNLGTIGEKVGVMKEDRDFTNPQRGEPVGILSSLFRMTYYWLDYVIGIPLILIRNVNADRYTIFDRYIYDFLIDPRRSHVNLPYLLRKIYTKLVCQPSIVFVLLTNAETIYARKQELTLEEIERQLGEFSRLASSNERFIALDAGLSPEEIVHQATLIILKRNSQEIKFDNYVRTEDK